MAANLHTSNVRTYAFTATDELQLRFDSKVDRTPGLGPHGECWEWRGAGRGNGYGAFKTTANEVVEAHRLAWMLANKTTCIPAGIEICHACDNRRCVRPNHLFAGTKLDNMRDAIEKGRLSPRPVLTESDVALCRRAAARGVSFGFLSRWLGVHRQAIWKAVVGLTFSSLTDPPPLTPGSRSG